MPVSVTSRYNGLPLLEGENGVYLGQRPVPPLATPEGSALHTLISGETLDQLAKRYYGREELWWHIADANPARHPADWTVGDTLVIPPLSAVRTGAV